MCNERGLNFLTSFSVMNNLIYNQFSITSDLI